MGAVQGFIPPTKWSNCSLQFLSNGLNNANLGVCLTNDPAATVGAPVCGNGILEGNEICDCGTPKVQCNLHVLLITITLRVCM